MVLRKTPVHWLLGLTILALPLGASAQVSPREPRAELPEWMREMKSSRPDAWTFSRAWKARADRLAESRRTGVASRMAGDGVRGVFQVPVFAVEFKNSPVEPWPVEELEDALFGWDRGSLTDFYAEISGNRAVVRGQVRGWHGLPEDDTWYEGTSAGTNPFNARIGELIEDTLDAWDDDVDFGLYDNDGPDGLPNSGDDDGYVDFVAFVHPESGAECGGELLSIWSHRWRYSAWSASGGVPYVTGDASASGGHILVDDYTIQPGLACDGTSRIQIGVFCHEFGHAFGLPDLYDTNGGSAGLGHWCLMASGNWNSPDSPAHMSAWAKSRLGWVDVQDVDWRGATVDIGPVTDTGTIWRIPTREERWRRRDDCAVRGAWSMAIGLDAVESAARGWRLPSGYGNGWLETVVHDFDYDGTGPVDLEFDYRVHTEAGFDFVFLFLEQDGKETTLAVFDGQSMGTARLDLAGALQPGPYRIGFRLRSDPGWSNEDGKFGAPCAAFAIDDFSVTGGGEDYFTGFEERRDGWFQPRTRKDNPLNEYWLVENRQARGFDRDIHGEGLVVYHVDEDVMGSNLQNTGGSSGESTRGIVVEEADGRFDLLAVGGNRGEASDVWPGPEATHFDLTSIPEATNNSGRVTGTRIEVLSESGGIVRARIWGGDPPPVLAAAEPDTLGEGFHPSVLEGSGFQPGVRVGLFRHLSPVVWATELEWVDHDLVRLVFDGDRLFPGEWDLLVENPDGQTVVREGAVLRAGQPVSNPPDARTPAAVALRQNAPNPFNPRTTIRFELPAATDVELAVFDLRGRKVTTLRSGRIEAGYHDVQWDGRDAAGREVASGLYFARLLTPEQVFSRKMMLAR